ncbi:MAG: hypothetical protein GWM98_04845 [Nitrospinaceae bacterium]|nr:hypothetical protein [Deltaproteobacteria bacterium]NIY14248.1 hypothetical protein [Nitrospinaceae bacterium]
MSDEEVEIYFDSIKHETDAAFLICFESDPFDPVQHWIPKSQVIDMDENKKRIIIPEWIAYQKDLI